MNPPNLQYDFIISGFGCAGMSFVFYLLNSSFKNSNILIIDPSSKSTNDRTWCYWAENPLAIHPKNSPLVFWENISIRIGERQIKKSLGNLKYYHIKSSDFYQEIKEQINQFPNVHFIVDSISNMEENNWGTVSVKTLNNGIFLGKKVFNSIPEKPVLNGTKKLLKQIFVGWRIKTQQPCFKRNTVLLMDFQQNSEQLTTFFYILPYSENEALIEYTVFSTQELDYKKMEPAIAEYISTSLGQKNFEILFKEEGSIPMTTFAASNVISQKITHLGTIAGCSKPSTGYTFHNIQKHCKSIVENLENAASNEKGIWSRKLRYAFYDNIILNIAKKWPKALPNVFFNLFETNPGAEILRFLNEETRFINELKILSKLKFPIFVKSLFHYEKH